MDKRNEHKHKKWPKGKKGQLIGFDREYVTR